MDAFNFDQDNLFHSKEIFVSIGIFAVSWDQNRI